MPSIQEKIEQLVDQIGSAVTQKMSVLSHRRAQIISGALKKKQEEDVKAVKARISSL